MPAQNLLIVASEAPEPGSVLLLNMGSVVRIKQDEDILNIMTEACQRFREA